ncbi:MAG: hypothetical protein PHE10_10320, partial [Kiritimatiellae bacterium]|nr:hypothetical protein [Kiritimatiellia bacterium]
KYGEQLSALGVEVEIFNPEFEHDPGDYIEEEIMAYKRNAGVNNTVRITKRAFVMFCRSVILCSNAGYP